jgi:2-succinyl-6-hydroxy-2,4-cyclohexadiene-1-carboxylate synthase
MTLHAEMHGDGPALVLLHGFTGSVATWEPACSLLAARHRVVAIDLPGHGSSPAPVRSGGLPHVAEELVKTLDRLAIETASWLGYSLGGRAALHVALAHPERVDRLVLESTSPGLADAGARAQRVAADDALAARIDREGIEAFVDAWMAQPLFATQRRLGRTLLKRERALRLRHDPVALAAALRAMSTGRQESLWDHLPRLHMPTLVVAGAGDHRYRALAEAMAARLPDARLGIVPGAGHTVHLENPVPFWSLVGAFLDQPIAAPGEGVAP